MDRTSPTRKQHTGSRPAIPISLEINHDRVHAKS